MGRREAPPHNHPPATPCLSEERLLWSPRVVLTESTLPASIHVSADGKIAEIWRKVKVPGHADAVLEAARAL